MEAKNVFSMNNMVVAMRASVLAFLCVFFAIPAVAQGFSWSENFGDCTVTGKGESSFSSFSPSVDWNKTDWVQENVHAGDGCVIIGISGAVGSLTTPALTGLNGDATLTFRVAGWETKEELTTFTLKLTGSGTFSHGDKAGVKTLTLDLVKAAYTAYLVKIVDGASDTKLTFAGDNGGTSKNNRFFLKDLNVSEGEGVISAAEISLSDTELTLSAGGEPQKLVATVFPEGAAVTFASSVETVATVDADGMITPRYEGKTTIEVTVPATEKYAAAKASCVVTVEAVAIYGLVYEKVTSNDQLVDGGVYLIVNEEAGVALGLQEDRNREQSSVTITDGSIESRTSLETGTEAYEITLQATDATTSGACWYLYDAKNAGWLYAASPTAAQLKVKTGVLTGTEKVSISISEGDASIVFEESGGYNILRYNSTSDLFSCYKSGQKPVQLYRKHTTLSTAEVVNNGGTFYAPHAYQMPEGLTGYAICEAQGGKAMLKKAYAPLAEVAPGSALYLHSAKAGTFKAAVLNKDVTPVEATEGNLLEGARGEDGKTTASEKAEEVYYYKLNTKNGSNPGFYWGAPDGGPFTMNRSSAAYLAIPQSAGIRGLTLDWSGVTGLESVTVADESSMKSGIFTLDGLRLSVPFDRLPAGIYVVNGKKILVK